MTIYNKIRNFQESQRLELKEQLPDNLEKEAVAFLNASGGELIIGVQDNGAVVGVDNPDAVQLKIKDRLVNNVRPSILGLFEIKLENHNDKTIVVTTFASGVEKPYYIKQKGRSEAGCFIRVGAAAQPMSEEMIDNLLNIRYPVSLANLPARNQDLNFTQLQIYYNGKQKPLSEKFAKTLDFYTPDGKYNQVAAIFSDENNFSFRLAKWFGTDKIDLCQKEEYGFRCLITVIEKVLSRLDTENITFARKMGLQQRVEQQLINQNALREAVVNAFAHNDYSQGNTPIFEIFSNRIEITTYGNLLQ
ncbi:MAG: putative DNA binding domain-containing protein, partial [Prevotellaceae bacterium]|nr:putative DNA binding domain-containing protein [Prevotellaceae bacterium]